MRLEGSTAIVTGGSRGIGRGIALMLAREGVNLVIGDLLAKPEIRTAANALLDEIATTQAHAIALDCDVRDADATARLVEAAVSTFGSLDIVCANAGIIVTRPVAEMELKDWSNVLETNLTGVFLTCRAALSRLMTQHRGAIVLISSIAGLEGYPGYASYCAAKAGVLGFMRALALEMAPFGVRVNAVCPGHIATEMWLSSILGEERKKGVDVHAAFQDVVDMSVPLGRAQAPEDIAEAVVYLCRAENVTGVVLPVDGGHMAGRW